MIFNDKSWDCHPERSEGSDAPGTEILRFAQDDKIVPVGVVKFHHRPLQ